MRRRSSLCPTSYHTPPKFLFLTDRAQLDHSLEQARSKTAKSFIKLGIAGGRLVPCNRRQPARMTPAEAEAAARKREEDARRTMEKILRDQQ
ncbi:MAG: hypothetical protein SCM96_15475 [Acidobacteriota bacterium]|nr:hypothetical protein [Acidobacteriota bacterium]